MKRSFMGLLAAAAMLGSLGQTVVRACGKSRSSTKRRRNPAGSKIARKAANGVLTMRAPGGLVAQTFREMQQRNFKQGANK